MATPSAVTVKALAGGTRPAPLSRLSSNWRSTSVPLTGTLVSPAFPENCGAIMSVVVALATFDVAPAPTELIAETR